MMVLDLLEHGAAGLSGAAGAIVTTLVAMAGRLEKRFKRLEALASRAASKDDVAALRDRLAEATSRGAVRAIVNELLVTTSRSDLMATKDAVEQALHPICARVTLLEQQIADTMPAADFAEHMAHDADRWAELNRSLGRIEGLVQALRDKLGVR